MQNIGGSKMSKNDQFYNFISKKCEFKEEDGLCKKSKTVCKIDACWFIKSENKSILTPAMELLNIIGIEYYHIPNKSFKNCKSKGQSYPDLFIFMDRWILTVEFKMPGKKLAEEQEEIRQFFSSLRYAKYKKIDNLKDFFEFVLFYMSKNEVKQSEKKITKIYSWLNKNKVKITVIDQKKSEVDIYG